MTLSQGKKQGLVIEVELDQYLTDANNILVYDRYSFGVSPKWVCDGYVYQNFNDAYYQVNGRRI